MNRIKGPLKLSSPPTRYTDIMLGCLILGGSFLYLGINIQEVPNISILKEEIKKKKENDFRDIDPDNLKLWKVEIPVGDNRLKQLMSNAEIDIDSISKDLGDAMFLDPMLNITRYFPETYNPPEEHVHILVQPPPPSVTTGSGQLKSLKTGKCAYNNYFPKPYTRF
ncbi:unnamed protein product [Rhizophagus irregularis]|nr:unnamed protein product [Rhizophagus irregularis]